MKVLLTGAAGQLGHELRASLSGYGEIIAVDRVPGQAGLIEQDLAEMDQLEDLLNRQLPDVVINAAAYTAVDQAEKEIHKAFRLNAVLPACLARWCKHNDRFLLHYSTDYVFDGESKRPYREDDLPAPISVYGESKLAGEWAIGASQCRHVILRTSWVYSTHGSNFVLNMLRLARQKSELSIVSDQMGCPTWARNLAQASVAVLRQSEKLVTASGHTGIYHYCDSSVLTWYDFARTIFEQAAELNLLHEIPRLKEIRSTEFPQVARRPAYSVLDTAAIQKEFSVTPPNVQDSLRACLEELGS